MNQPHPDGFLPDDAIDHAASEWVCERDEGFAAGRAQAFAAWCAADPRHEAAVARTEQALALLAEMPAIRGSLQSRLSAQGTPGTRFGRGGAFRGPAWTAGLAAALLFATGLIWLGRGRTTEPQHYVTAASRQRQIALNDGSVVNLNVNSDVRVRLTPNERRVTLAAGEAHFAVAHDTARPFIVTAAGVAVRAVGTAFSVRVAEAGVAVLVTEGRVEVTRMPAPTTSGPAENVNGPMLTAGERTLISRDAPTVVERVSADALHAAVRWHSQVMTFSDLPLREAAALFNRRNETQLVLADAELGERKIGGVFAADQVEAFVRLLEKDGDVVATGVGTGEIRLRRAP